jgi:syntaxin 16
MQSITELANIFKELGTLVSDQGTILDRIDYNVEVAATHVDKGHGELVQTENYQKKAGKKMFIVLLIVIIIGLIFAVLFAKKVKENSSSSSSSSSSGGDG